MAFRHWKNFSDNIISTYDDSINIDTTIINYEKINRKYIKISGNYIV
jgi:hypothetical protein